MPLDIHQLSPGKKVFFASDFHLGAPNKTESLEREKKIIRWHETIQNEAEAIIFLGDMFDFWYEFGHVIPKGFVRLQGKLASLADQGIKIAVFTGNHDMWMFGYFKQELGIEVYHVPQHFTIQGKYFFAGHGDGLGPGDIGYKLINWIFFKNKILQHSFRWINPNYGMWMGLTWAKYSFKKKRDYNLFFGEKEWLYRYCKQIESKEHHDYYIFGHRHKAIEMNIAENSRYYNLGEWISACSFAVFDGEKLVLKNFEQQAEN